MNSNLMDPESCMGLVRTLAMIAFLFQALEELSLENSTRSLLFPAESEVRRFFGGFLPLNLRSIALARIALILWILMDPLQPIAIVLLFLASWLRSVRFLGSLNGGSDTMSQVLLIPLVLVSCSGGSSAVTKGALLWIGIQSVLSYFLSGVRKAKNRGWWDGVALSGFVRRSRVLMASSGARFLKIPLVVRTLSLMVLMFEILFPLSLISLKLCSLFLVVGVMFHFGVFLAFGLNRFFWVWIASYPAIYFIASSFWF